MAFPLDVLSRLACTIMGGDRLLAILEVNVRPGYKFTIVNWNIIPCYDSKSIVTDGTCILT